jgi:peptidoglycan hydrolase-like protein with peptidoglycan-binding domain
MKSLAYAAGLVAVAAVVGLSAIPSGTAFAQSRSAAPAAQPMAQKAMPSEQVKALQTALNKNGAKLKVDGLMGARTKDALKKYQSANGLRATGESDAATRAKLGI